MRTIQRDILALQDELKLPLTQEGDRYSILDGYVLPPVSLSLYEAVAAFLSLRLTLRQMDRKNPHIKRAITKIAALLPQSLATDINASVSPIIESPEDTELVHVFEQIALAWTTRRKMHITYQALQSNEIKEWELEPYFVETTGVGYSTYVIGNAVREDKQGIFTFKLDRIRSAQVLDTNFEIPPEFDITKLLSSSWGIIWGEETEIKLKFSPAVARRVKESTWHPSQVLEDLSDGSVLMTLKIGSTLEITPWIRSWGPDVEVLSPEELRNSFKQYANQLFNIYTPYQREGEARDDSPRPL
jgi:predicted DNA-binding transcriptional regulator YafY